MSKIHIDARERGVAVLEFALVFTVVWAVFWSMVCYVVPLLVQQAMHRATAEGAQVAAMTISPSLRVTQAKQTALNAMNWLPASWLISLSADGTRAITNSNCPLVSGVPSACLLEVSLTMAYASNAPLKPIIGLPGIGTIPSLPTTLSSKSSILLR
ncbi:MAG: TadE/TadG family type IV pilus assembly protein [Paraperlucidibaca sp.]